MARYELIEDEEVSSPGRYELLEEEIPQTTGAQTSRGVAQGLLDITSIPALLSYPIERGAQKLFGLEDKPGQLTPGQEASYSVQHQILEKMQEPGYVPSLGEFLALSDDDDLVPRYGGGGTALSNVQELQKNIPEGGATQELIRRGTRNLPFLLGGPALYGAATGADVTGYGASEAVKGMGGGEGAQLGADILGSLLFGGFNALRTSTTKVPAVAEKTGGLLSKAELKGSQAALQKRIQELDGSMINKLEENTSKLSQKAFSDFPAFEAQEINRDIVKGNQTSLLNRIAPETTPQEAWTRIGEQVEEAFQKERKMYSALYEGVKKRAQGIMAAPEESRNLAAQLLRKIRNVETTAPGYEAVGKALNSALTDLGVSVQNVNGVNQLVSKPITLDKMLDVAVRLGEVVNYENLTPSIKDLLKPLVKQLKTDIKGTLRKQSPATGLAYEKAERSFASAAERFGNDAIMKLRKSETPENLTNFFSSPSNYNRLKAVGSENSLSIADRQIIEELAAKGTDSARKEMTQLEKYFSQANKDIANNLIDLGDKLTAPGQKAVLQQRILEDAQRAVTSGERPSTIMRAMQTPEGYNIAKQTLERTPKGKDLFKVMQKQFVQDLFNSVVDDAGKINWSKAANLIKDPQVKAVLRAIGGDDLLNFFRSMETYGTNIRNNFANHVLTNRSLSDDLIKLMKPSTKKLIGLMVGSGFGTVAGAATTAGLWAAGEAFWRMLANPKVQGIIKALQKPESYDKNKLMPLIAQLNKLLGQ